MIVDKDKSGLINKSSINEISLEEKANKYKISALQYKQDNDSFIKQVI